MPGSDSGPRIAAIITACNEADVLGQTLASLRAASPPPDLLLVIADHCTDQTAAVAEQWGAVVLQRNTGASRKGAALTWAMTCAAVQLANYPLVAVFDADSRVTPRFFAEVRRGFADGARVVQGYVRPVDLPKSPAVILSAYSEILAQHLDDVFCAWLGGTVRLRGKGMVFETRLLRELLPRVQTQVEDTELTFLLADRHIRIVAVRAAVVLDPTPKDLGAASRQRARWFRGQLEALRAHPGVVARLLLQGPPGWWLLQDALLRPRSLLWCLVAGALGAASLFTSSLVWLEVLAAVLVISGTYYIGGLLLIPASERAGYARALLLAPLYVGMWCVSIIMAWGKREVWLSVRHP